MIHGYIRVSTDGQNEGSSPEEQELHIRAMATVRGDPEPTFWRDTISGSVPVNERLAGGEMVAVLQRGDVVIAAKLDRLFRNAEDALARSRAWREAGVDLVLADMGTEPVTTSAAGRMYFGMLAQFAEFERERIRERISGGKARKRDRGGFIGGNAPIGYHVEGSGKDATIQPNEAEIRMVAHARHIAGMEDVLSPSDVAKKMNRLGYKTRKGTDLVATHAWRWIRRRTFQFEGPEPEPNGRQVYRCYDGLGRLRYIGSTVDARNRVKGGDYNVDCSDLDHDWYAWVVRVTIENHPTREAGFAAEYEAQRNEDIYVPPRRELTEYEQEVHRRIVEAI